MHSKRIATLSTPTTTTPLANYHVWETLVLWDNPDTYGVARKRVDVKGRKSVFNTRAQAHKAMEYLIDQISAQHLLVSFNNEGFLTGDDITRLLSDWGYVARFEREYRQYVGSLIGIYNPQGQRVGRVSHTRNREMLFLATKNKSVHEALPEDTPRAISTEQLPLW